MVTTKLKIKLESTNFQQLQKYIDMYIKKYFFIYTIISLPNKIERLTILRSPHIDKKSREQYELKKYKKLCILDLQNNSIKKCFYLLLKALPATCKIKFYY